MSDRRRADNTTSSVDWAEDDEASIELPVGYLPDGVVTLRYLWDAVRRHVRLWVAIVVLGLAVGSLVPVVLPPPSEATTKVLLTHRDGVDSLQAMATDVSLASTRTVASRVIVRMELDESADELLGRYEVTQLTDRIMEISVRAPTDKEARLLADTIAYAFLEFQLEQVRAQQRPIKRQLSSARNDLIALQEQLADEPELRDARTEARLGRLDARVAQLRQRLDEQRAAVTMASTSRVLDPGALVPRSQLKTVVLDVATGMAGGLVFGLGFVILRALVSDRAWRRQVIAESLGAPVAVNLSAVGRNRWWRLLPARLARRHRIRFEQEMQGAARHLRRLFSVTDGPAALSVIAASDERTTARLVAKVVRMLADGETRVLTADLSSGGWLAKELHHTVPLNVPEDLKTIEIYLPDTDEAPPEGLAKAGDERLGSTGPEGLDSAWERADLVVAFTGVSLLRGLDHLRSWASRAVVVVSAGACTATKLRTTAELIALADVRLDSAIVLRGDRTDETAGVPVELSAQPATARLHRTRVR